MTVKPNIELIQKFSNFYDFIWGGFYCNDYSTEETIYKFKFDAFLKQNFGKWGWRRRQQKIITAKSQNSKKYIF